MSDEIEKIGASLKFLKKERPNNYRPYTTTLVLQRKNFCAKIITRSIREFSLRTRDEKQRLKRKRFFEKQF